MGPVSARTAVAAVLAAAQLGTAFMLAAEAGTAPTHREALRGEGDTELTRAFTGRTARGLVNRFLREHSADAPSAYPEVHHLTAPLHAAARARDDADALHLWAGQAYSLAEELSAGELVRRLSEEASRVLPRRRAASSWGGVSEDDQRLCVETIWRKPRPAAAAGGSGPPSSAGEWYSLLPRCPPRSGDRCVPGACIALPATPSWARSRPEGVRAGRAGCRSDSRKCGSVVAVAGHRSQRSGAAGTGASSVGL
jgi:hypothetical protein